MTQPDPLPRVSHHHTAVRSYRIGRFTHERSLAPPDPIGSDVLRGETALLPTNPTGSDVSRTLRAPASGGSYRIGCARPEMGTFYVRYHRIRRLRAPACARNARYRRIRRQGAGTEARLGAPCPGTPEENKKGTGAKPMPLKVPPQGFEPWTR